MVEVSFQSFYFGITVDLQKSYKDSIESSNIRFCPNVSILQNHAAFVKTKQFIKTKQLINIIN